MPVATGVITTAGANKFAQALVNGSAMVAPSYFKFSEGGWQSSGSSRVPRTPDPAQTDVDSIQNPSRYPADSRFVFQKSFVPGDVTFDSPGACRCSCLLDFSESNNDGFGNDPEFYELGVYDSDNVLLAYVTFPVETKNSSKQLQHFVRISFGGA